MKRIITLFSLVGLSNACAFQLNAPLLATGDVAKCPTQSTPALLTASEEEGFFDRFDYHIQNIVADADTVKFQALKYDFVFCRGNSTWTVQPGTLTTALPPKDASDYYKELENPPLKTIVLNGETYQYRVILEPNPFPINDSSLEPEKVVFELITPESEQPQRQTLYTLAEAKQAATAANLGVPSITAALSYGDRLFWSVSPEQGEGSGGIATLVSYDPQAQEIGVIQPEKTKGEQITDMAITGEPATPTFWLGTKSQGEGNPNLPGLGLVAYRPSAANLKSGSVTAYSVRNSPLVGAIPDQLLVEGDRLWVATGNGVCQVLQRAAEELDWSCWRFTVQATLPREGLPLYSALLNTTPADTLTPAQAGETVEVLWFSPLDYQTRKGRYEVRYDKGLTVTLAEQGAIAWSEIYTPPSRPPGSSPPVYWPGREWHWDGDRFSRGFDEVALNFFGNGPRGIGPNQVDGQNRLDLNAIRGDLELLALTKNSTTVKYYSGWVEESLLNPYLSVVPQVRSQNPQPDPLQAIANQLQ